MTKIVGDEADEASPERVLARREALVRERELAMDERELAMGARELAIGAGDAAMGTREEARDAAAAARDRLLAQVQQANERLVLATLRVQDLADDANAARLAIEQSEERFRSLVMTSAAVVWHASAEGHIEVEAESWRRFTGTTVEASEAPAWGWLADVHPEDRDRVREAWEASVAESGRYLTDHRLRRGDGTYAWVTSRAVPIPGSGLVREWIGVMTDVSDRVRLDEARDRFIGILGHDLRSPLSAVKMGAYLLERADLPARATDLAVRITRSVYRMEAMIDALLLFARGRLGGGIPLVRRACELGRLCADQVEETRQAFPARAIDCATSGDLTGDWDPDRLQQALSNLLSNAVAHGQDPIRVTARGEGADVTLVVQNQGPPIPASSLPALFEPFRARASSKGLGLGLYIVSEIVRAHGGTLAAHSAEGEGTAFTVVLPRRAPLPRD